MNVEVFKQRFLPFHDKLFRIAYALVENQADAEDILQETYCKLWNMRNELDNILNPEAFSVTLVKNLSLDFLRSPKARHNEGAETLERIIIASDSSPEKEQEERDDIRHIQRLIELLPTNQRQVLRLFSIEDHSYEEIEQITGLSPSNIRTLLFRARKFIREKFDKSNSYG
ncbi:RNA polymerase sigma factor [Bacteroides sp.]|uniref:RNA polymerase sigma factor n=1 Tax=Bacteroides sp. TaxID=29523 RepID=UPI00261F6531|nr:RNA polymerase sigma factor [Bacteroides sp.]MDD3036470.1 RNA polymerase sigma factor [Bacteroides sp.]